MNIGMSLISGNTATQQGTVNIPVTKDVSSLAETSSTEKTAAQSESPKGVNVTISKEGAEKQAAEANGSAKPVTPTLPSAEITKVKDKIAKVKKQIKALANDHSPEAQDKIKLLQGKLSTLTASAKTIKSQQTNLEQKTKTSK